MTENEIEVNQYRFIEDPGHGWLEVPRAVLKFFGIEDQITGFSYQSGNLVYLEEDMDLSTFMRAFREKFGKSINYYSEHQENTFVRDLPYYEN